MKQQLLARFLAATRLRGLLSGIWPANGVVILNYHRIGDASVTSLDRDVYSADADTFDAQMAFLQRHCDVISPDEIDAALRTRRGRHVLITFDDGYRDNHVTALPILRSHGLKATFFLTTGFIDRPQLPWWDEIAMLVRNSATDQIDLSPWLAKPLVLAGPSARDAAIRQVLNVYKALPGDQSAHLLECLRHVSGATETVSALSEGLWMTWDMVRDLHAHGMTIGGHTVSHPLLARISDAQQWLEISGCARRIREEVGQAMRYFAYPVGSRDAFNAHTLVCLQRVGVQRAFSYYGGYARLDASVFDTQRMPIEQYTTTERFRAIVQLPRFFARLQH